MGKDSEQAAEGFVTEELGVQGPWEQERAPQHQSPGRIRAGWRENRAQRWPGPQALPCSLAVTEEEHELNDDFCDQIAKHWIYQVLSLPPSGARPPEQPRKELLGPGRRGDEHREGAQNERHTKMSPVPTRVADCTMVTTGVNQSWMCFKKESLKH